MDSVKFALLSKSRVDSGGRPCLHKSARVRGCNGFAASRLISPSVTVAVWICRRLGLHDLPVAKPSCLAAARRLSITGTTAYLRSMALLEERERAYKGRGECEVWNDSQFLKTPMRGAGTGTLSQSVEVCSVMEQYDSFTRLRFFQEATSNRVS